VKKVVYISYMPLSEKVERDWYLAELRSRGVSLAYWDVTALLLPGVHCPETPERDYVVKVGSYDRFKELIQAQDVPGTNFVLLLNYEGRFSRLFTLLTLLRCRTYFFEWGNFPIQNRRCVSGVLNRLRQPGKLAAALANRLKSALLWKLKLVKPFDVVFTAGAVATTKHPRAGRLVQINLCDYDNYLQARCAAAPVARPYAVFLDINLAFQTDLKILGWECVDARAYGDSLCRFFAMVEQRFGVEVVIAAHPKASYGESYFGGRTILKGATPELVQDARMVISHHSTSISYAVLNQKPLLFIYTEGMQRIYADTVVSYIKDFAGYLGQPVYNTDALKHPGELEVTPCDPGRYDQYKYNYLTSKESEGRLNRDIVVAELAG
jgi:hypothetical protein